MAHETVLVRLEGGLGNQMFQYAAGRAVALRTSRDLALDTTAIARGPSLRSYELHAFRIAGRLARWTERLEARLQVGDRIPHAFRETARRLSLRRWSLLADDGIGVDQRVFRTPGNIVLQGPWQCVGYAESDGSVAQALRADFGLRDPLPAVAARVQAEIMSGNAVGVHVRRGDYVTNTRFSAFHGVLPTAYPAAAAASIASRVASPRFFVFSDDIEWAASHLHLPGPAWFVRETQGLPPSIDLWLMASCRHFIIANSTFSWWAAWLGFAPGKIVVAPQRWFATSPMPAMLLARGWEVL